MGSVEDAHEVALVQIVDGAHDREPADELGDESEVEEVFRQHVGEDRARILVGLADHVCHEAHALPAHAPFDDLVQTRECAAADEQHVGGVDGEELLVRMLASTLRRDARDRALQDLEQRLLHALTRDVARDGRVVRLARDLVDLVDVDDARLGALDVEVGRLDELEQDVLDVLPDVAGLGERRGVGDGERDVEDARQRLGEECLAAAGGTEQRMLLFWSSTSVSLPTA